MMEKGAPSPVGAICNARLSKVLNLPATALPLRSEEVDGWCLRTNADFKRGTRGARFIPDSPIFEAGDRRNRPRRSLLDALNNQNLDARVAGGLPWLADLR